MSPELANMVNNAVRSAQAMKETAEAMGTSFIPALPIKVGDVVGGIRVEKITFEVGCYMKASKFFPGYRAIGPVMIGANLPGSSRKSIVFDLFGLPVSLTQT